MENNYGDYKDYSNIVKQKEKQNRWTIINLVLCISLTISLIVGFLGFTAFREFIENINNGTSDNPSNEDGHIMMIGLFAIIFFGIFLIFFPFLLLYLVAIYGSIFLSLSSIICLIVHRKKEIFEKKDIFNLVYSLLLVGLALIIKFA